MVNGIKKIILGVDEYGSYKSWAHIANDELLWSILVNNLGRDDPPTRDFPDTQPLQSRPPPPQPPQTPSPQKSSPRINKYSSNFNNLFDILEINSTSIEREVIVAYRKLARIYHPDKWSLCPRNFTQEEGNEKFKSNSNAYEELKNSNTLF